MALSAGPPADPVAAVVARVRDRFSLLTARTVLRPPGPEDVAPVHAYRSRPDVARYLPHASLDEQGATDLVGEWCRDPGRLHLLIEHQGRVVGDAGVRLRVSPTRPPARTEAVEASLGCALSPDLQGRGLATEAVAALVDALLRAGVRRIGARVFAPATASSRLLARLGFHHDGTERAAVLAPDASTWWDDESWSLLATDPVVVERP